jgi:hypothetical protein
VIQKIFTKDFAVSDNIKTLNTQKSWILENVNFLNTEFSMQKITNLANCKTPT